MSGDLFAHASEGDPPAGGCSQPPQFHGVLAPCAGCSRDLAQADEQPVVRRSLNDVAAGLVEVDQSRFDACWDAP